MRIVLNITNLRKYNIFIYSVNLFMNSYKKYLSPAIATHIRVTCSQSIDHVLSDFALLQRLTFNGHHYTMRHD